ALQSQLPPGLVLLAVDVAQGSYDPKTGVWSVGSVANGATLTLQLRAKVGNPADQQVASDITAADQFDPDPSQARSLVSERIQKADLSVTASISNASPTVGNTVTYTIEVANVGPDNATHIIITAALPHGMKPSAVTVSQGTYDPATGIWVLGTLDAG